MTRSAGGQKITLFLARFSTTHHPWDRRTRRTASDLLWQVARTAKPQLPARLVRNPSGRPIVTSCSVSLSYAKGIVALGISESGPIGIDIEPCHRRLDPETIGAVFGREFVTGLDSEQTLHRCMALEAIFKCLATPKDSLRTMAAKNADRTADVRFIRVYSQWDVAIYRP